jgi:hypothetical protein
LYRALQPYSPFTDIGSYAVSTCWHVQHPLQLRLH